jgi:hypothetical protein
MVISFGMTLSAIHIHFDDFNDVETDTMIVEQEFHCVICGSVLKTDPNIQDHEIISGYPETSHFQEVVAYSHSPFSAFKDGRAPPFLS